MATLNSTETEQLRVVRALLSQIERHGYDPNGPETGRNGVIRRALKEGQSALHTVVTMKGYYPS